LEDRSAIVVALGSALASEGKSTVSALFAMHLAWSGARVLLVDYDFRRGGLTRRLRPYPYDIKESADKARDGAAAGAQESSMLYDGTTGLCFLPAPGRDEAAREISRVIAEGMDYRISSLKSCFDFIILDLPPLFHLPQGPMLARALDRKEPQSCARDRPAHGRVGHQQVQCQGSYRLRRARILLIGVSRFQNSVANAHQKARPPSAARR
jgi:Mrp family chromosome partitioning ATPase